MSTPLPPEVQALLDAHHAQASAARGREPLTEEAALAGLQAACEDLLGFPVEQIPSKSPDLRGQLTSVLKLVASALASIDLVGPMAGDEKPTTSPGKVARFSEYLDAGGVATARAHRRKRR